MNFNNEYFRENFDTIPKNSSNVTDKDYQCSDNYVVTGENSKQIKNTSMMNCKDACEDDKNCIGFNYNDSTNECILKKNANSFVNQSNNTFCIKKSLANNKCSTKNKSESENTNNSVFNELHNIFADNGIENEIELKNKISQMKANGELTGDEIKKITRLEGNLNQIIEMKESGDSTLTKNEIQQIVKSNGNISPELKNKIIQLNKNGTLTKSELKNIIQTESEGGDDDDDYDNDAENEEGEEESEEEEDDEDEDEDEDDEESEGESEEEKYELVTKENDQNANSIKKMLRENTALNEKITKKIKMRKNKKRRAKIYVDLKCFMSDMKILSTHSEGIMIELPLLLSYIKSCAFIKKRKMSKNEIKRKIQQRIKKSGHTLTEQEKDELKSEYENKLSSPLKMPKPTVVTLNSEDQSIENYENINNEISNISNKTNKNQIVSECSMYNYNWSWEFMTILKISLLVLLLVLIFNQM
jgi:hypothetical protein